MDETHNACTEAVVYSREQLLPYRNIKGFQTMIIEKLAAERNWVYDFQFEGLSEPPVKNGSSTVWELRKVNYYHDIEYLYQCGLENGDYIHLRLYNKKNCPKGLYAEAVVFHWGAKRDFCAVCVVPVCNPSRNNDEPELLEHVYQRCSAKGMKVEYTFVETFAFDYDIHNHSHYELSAGFVYDAEKKCAYYDDSYLKD